MKSSAKDPLLQQGAMVLGIIGGMLILTYLFDFGLQLTAAQADNPNWSLGFLNELIDRGVTPLLGLTFIFIGGLIKFGSQPQLASGSLIKDSRFWLFVVASLFGLLYIIVIPFHFSAVGEILGDAISQEDSKVAQAEQVTQSQLNQLKTIAESGELDKLLTNEQLPPAQKELFTRYKADPEAVQAQAQEELTKIKTQKETAVNRANSDATKARLRSEVRSLLLAIAYAALGWTGLRIVLRG